MVSSRGDGTTFTLDFPSTEEAVERPDPVEEREADKEVILVIDDDDSVRNVLVAMLKHLGHEVVFAADGPSGIEKLSETHFSMVLTDLGMPGMSGWEVANAVKEKSPDTPVVLITGWGREICAKEAETNQVDYVLPKPFQLCNISAMIDEMQTMRG